MKSKTSKKEKKRLFLITTTIIVLLLVLVGSVFKDWKQIIKNRQLENELNSKYEYLLNEEEKLNSEITKLQDDEYLRRYAREKYMLSSEDDTILIIK